MSIFDTNTNDADDRFATATKNYPEIHLEMIQKLLNDWTKERLEDINFGQFITVGFEIANFDHRAVYYSTLSEHVGKK